jgi:hypothetical protein
MEVAGEVPGDAPAQHMHLTFAVAQQLAHVVKHMMVYVAKAGAEVLHRGIRERVENVPARRLG